MEAGEPLFLDVLRVTLPEYALFIPLFFLFKQKNPLSLFCSKRGGFTYAGGDLLSHTVSRAVPSALKSLTSVFGMGTGGSSPL